MASFQLTSFENAHSLAKSVAVQWLDEVVTANRSRQPYCVALSGGRITLKFFAMVIDLAKSRNVPLTGVHFFWADERCVPPDDPESNFAAAEKHFFQPLAIASGNIHRIRGEDDPASASRQQPKQFSA